MFDQRHTAKSLPRDNSGPEAGGGLLSRLSVLQAFEWLSLQLIGLRFGGFDVFVLHRNLNCILILMIGLCIGAWANRPDPPPVASEMTDSELIWAFFDAKTDEQFYKGVIDDRTANNANFADSDQCGKQSNEPGFAARPDRERGSLRVVGLARNESQVDGNAGSNTSSLGPRLRVDRCKEFRPEWCGPWLDSILVSDR